MLRRQPRGWLALSLVTAVLAVMGVIDAVWRIAHGALWPLATLPVGLLLYFWIGVGAWRRTELVSERPLRQGTQLPDAARGRDRVHTGVVTRFRQWTSDHGDLAVMLGITMGLVGAPLILRDWEGALIALGVSALSFALYVIVNRTMSWWEGRTQSGPT